MKVWTRASSRQRVSRFLVITIIFTGFGCSGGSTEQAGLILENTNLSEYILAQEKNLRSNPNDPVVHFQLAAAYYKEKSYAKAETHIRIANQLSPLRPAYFELLGDISFQQQRYGDALNAFSSAIRISPELLSVYLKLALTYEKIGEAESAIASLDEVLQKEPRYVEALYHLARISLNRRAFENALQSINRVLVLEPDNQEAALLQIRIYTEQGSYFHAKTLAQDLINAAPERPQARRELIRVLFVQHQWTDAVEQIMLLEKQNQLRVEEQLIHAHILLERKESDKANQLLLQIIEKDALNINAMNELAMLHLQADEMEQAMLWLSRGLEVNSKNPEAYYLQATIFYKQNNFLEGDLALNRALEQDSFNLAFQLLSLRRQLMKGDIVYVEQQVQQLLAKDPLNMEVRRLEADLYVIQEKYLKAESLLRQLLVLSDSDLVQFSLARVLYLQGDYNKVLSLTEKLRQKYPSSWESYYLHTMTLNRLGRFQKETAESKVFLEKKEGQGYIHRLIGDMYRYQNNEEEAQKVYRQGLERFPDHLELIDALSLLYIRQNKWEEARELLESVIGMEHSLKSIFLNRLIIIFQQLSNPEKALYYLKQFNYKNDPIFKAQRSVSENRLLFPISSPSLGYEEFPEVFMRE
ncbi:tetratricopeptide repeat protein [Deltaproteobacteria bacterium TL4]